MKKLALIAAALGLFAFSRNASASAPTYAPQDLGGQGGPAGEWGGMAGTENPLPDVALPDPDANVAAFLSAIAWSEGTEGRADPYRVCYGYRHTIQNFADHPAASGEWRGKALPDGVCAAAGFGPGCVSTAAGRYQIIKPTWQRAKRALGLPDFGPASQDAAAVWLIQQRGALDAVRAGKFAQAVQLCRKEWASLPGSGWGQPERRLEQLAQVYENAGGVVA